MTASQSHAYIIGVKRTTLTAEELRALRAVPVTASHPNRLRIVMSMLTLTQADVATGTSLTQATISDIYNARYADLKHSTVSRLSFLFGCAIEDLFPRVVASERDQPALPFQRKTAVAR